LHEIQRFYTTWDGDGLRLAWAGANWDTDGDLFVYLDTESGGASQAYDPYSTDAVTISLPGVTPASDLGTTDQPITARTVFRRQALDPAQQDPLEADYLIWVTSSDTAQLLTWGGVISGWVELKTLNTEEYGFDAQSNGGQTDLRLLFTDLGITNPDTVTLRMVAAASRDDSLSLWAAMPAANPVNDERLHGYTGSAHVFALSHDYEWNDLGAGFCPNGSTSPGGVRPYADSELLLSLTAEPAGTTYGYLGDSLFWMWYTLLGGGPDQQEAIDGRDNQAGSLADLGYGFLDTDHALAQNGQLISYTIHYENLGTVTSTNAIADVSSFFALRLPAGTTIPAEERDSLLLNLMDIGPGVTGTVTFVGQIDVTTAQSYYDDCVSDYPDYPLLCLPYLDTAAVDVLAYDDVYTTTGQPMEWLFGEHPVDYEGPRFFGLQEPTYQVSLDPITFQGYAYDLTGVLTITLGFVLPSAPPSQVTCPDATPDNGVWSCVVDLSTLSGGGSLQDGDTFTLRVQATDGTGLDSDWGPAHTLVIDTTPPTNTVSLQQQIVSQSQQFIVQDDFALFGLEEDNWGIGQVEVCVDSNCEHVEPPATARRFVYEDTASPAVDIDSGVTCDGNEEIRTFVVSDTFTVGTVQLGFNAVHAFRDDLDVRLQAPSDEEVQVILGTKNQFDDGQDYDVLLSDPDPVPLHTSGDDDPTRPYYDRSARPYDPLYDLYGEAAAGTWDLVICDDVPAASDGAYHRAQLILTPPDDSPRSGEWHRSIEVAEGTDGVLQTVQISAQDEVGNSGTTLEFTVLADNVAPAITVTEVITAVDYTSLLIEIPPEQMEGDDDSPFTITTTRVITGVVTDGGQLDQLFLTLEEPNGQRITETLTLSGTQWSYDLSPHGVGVYRVWITAVDTAGNTTQSGSYEIELFVPPWVLKEVEADSVFLGDTVEYRLTVYNDNARTIFSSVVITDELPSGLSPVPSADYSILPGNTIVWPPFTAEANSVYSLTFTAAVTNNLGYVDRVISNTALYVATGFDLGGSDPVDLQLVPVEQVYLPLVVRNHAGGSMAFDSSAVSGEDIAAPTDLGDLPKWLAAVR